MPRELRGSRSRPLDPAERETIRGWLVDGASCAEAWRRCASAGIEAPQVDAIYRLRRERATRAALLARRRERVAALAHAALHTDALALQVGRLAALEDRRAWDRWRFGKRAPASSARWEDAWDLAEAADRAHVRARWAVIRGC